MGIHPIYIKTTFVTQKEHYRQHNNIDPEYRSEIINKTKYHLKENLYPIILIKISNKN